MMKNPLFSFILSTLEPFKWWICALCIVNMIWAIDLSLRPYLIKLVLDQMSTTLPHYAYKNLIPPAVNYVLMSVLVVAIHRLYNFIWLKFSPPLKQHVGLKVMERMMNHSQYFYQNHFAGSLGNKIKDVMQGVPALVEIIIDQFLSHTLAILIAIVTLGHIHSWFALGLFVWIIVFAYGSIKLSKTVHKLSEACAEENASVVGTIVDILSNIASVHLFSGKKSERRQLYEILKRYVSADQKRDWVFLKIFTFQEGSFVLYQSLCFFLLIFCYKAGFVTPGDFAMVLTINISIIDSLWSLTTEMSQFAKLKGTITQGLRLILETVDIQDSPNAQPLIVDRGEIRFEAVQFRYKKSTPLFSKQSVVIPAGQKVGLVGFSGSGKSSFVNLILRFFDVTEGRILIDNQDIREVTQESLHNTISMIPQEPSLFHRNLRENIRYGKSDATDEEVIAAAQKAYAHEFIIHLPQGYDTVVGERGIKLSGGQRQRITIARAILKNAPILILDEATSQLDAITENAIQDTLRHIMHNKTTLVIAHRLSTLLYMDRILVFNQGHIVEDGTHQELLDQGGLYKTLWEAQTKGVLPCHFHKASV